MFDMFYTTHMSVSHKQLQSRFLRMRSGGEKRSRIPAVAMSLVLLITVCLATVAAAMMDASRQERYVIQVTGNGTAMAFENPPFYENGSVYLPLRELMENLGIMDMEYSRIEWDNGFITLYLAESVPAPEWSGNAENGITQLRYCYGLEIGQTKLGLNPVGTEAEERWGMSIVQVMSRAPKLVEDVTYIPFEYAETILNRAMQTHSVGYSVWDTTYQKGTDRQPDITEHAVTPAYLKATESEWTESSEQVITKFFDAFSRQDFEEMKGYCTEKFITKRFRDNTVFGIKKAELLDVRVHPLQGTENEKYLKVQYVANRGEFTKVPIKDVPVTIYISAVKQTDGSWLIDKFGLSPEELTKQ